MLSFAAPKILISCCGNNSTMMSATSPTVASAISSFVKSSLTRSSFPAPILNPTMGMQPAAIPTTIEITIWKNFITMPTTAIGIWAYCSRPKTGSSAPYFLIILLIAAIAATREICDRKLVRPRIRVLRQIFLSIVKSAPAGFTSFI